MPQISVSQRELLEIQDRLHEEAAFIEKLGAYTHQTNDQDLKRVFQEIQTIHMRNFDVLVRELGASLHWAPGQYAGTQAYGATPYAQRYQAGHPAGTPYQAGGYHAGQYAQEQQPQ